MVHACINSVFQCNVRVTMCECDCGTHMWNNWNLCHRREKLHKTADKCWWHILTGPKLCRRQKVRQRWWRTRAERLNNFISLPAEELAAMHFCIDVFPPPFFCKCLWRYVCSKTFSELCTFESLFCLVFFSDGTKIEPESRLPRKFQFR